jgi:hypothetical protein
MKFQTATMWMTPFLLTLCISCGAGTEIGNGFKPGSGDDGNDKQGANDSFSDKDTSGEAPSDQGSKSDEDDNNLFPSSILNEDTLGFDMPLLFTECASPWRNDIQTKLEFEWKVKAGSKTQALLMHLNFDEAQQIWSVYDKKDSVDPFLFIKIEKIEDKEKIILQDKDNVRVSPAYECVGTVDSITQETYPSTTIRTAHLIPKGSNPNVTKFITLKWTMRDQAGSAPFTEATRGFLQKIEINLPDSAKAIVLTPKE